MEMADRNKYKQKLDLKQTIINRKKIQKIQNEPKYHQINKSSTFLTWAMMLL